MRDRALRRMDPAATASAAAVLFISQEIAQKQPRRFAVFRYATQKRALGCGDTPLFIHNLLTKQILRDMMYNVKGGILWTFS